uniref:hypothetical protein n=1 Tax=Bacillus altitudinis TaxID=293387 RepID=UPI003B5205E5
VNECRLVGMYFEIDEVEGIFLGVKGLDVLSGTGSKKCYSQIGEKLFGRMCDERKDGMRKILDVID